MSHWMLDSLGEARNEALKQASQEQIYQEVLKVHLTTDQALIHRTGEVLEMVVLDLLSEGLTDDEEKTATLKTCAADAFRLFRILPTKDNALECAIFKLRTSALAVLGDRGADGARFLRESPWPELSLDSEDWGQRTWATIIDIW